MKTTLLKRTHLMPAGAADEPWGDRRLYRGWGELEVGETLRLKSPLRDDRRAASGPFVLCGGTGRGPRSRTIDSRRAVSVSADWSPTQMFQGRWLAPICSS